MKIFLMKIETHSKGSGGENGKLNEEKKIFFF